MRWDWESNRMIWCHDVEHFLNALKFNRLKHYDLTSSHRMPYKPAIFVQPPIGRRINTHYIFLWVCREPCQQPCQHATRAVTLCGMTCVSRSPRGHGSVAPDKRHWRQWMSSLFCGFLPNPFIHDLFLWHTSQEFVKTDLYPLSLMSLRSIMGCCFGACQRSSCAEERRLQ